MVRPGALCDLAYERLLASAAEDPVSHTKNQFGASLTADDAF